MSNFILERWSVAGTLLALFALGTAGGCPSTNTALAPSAAESPANTPAQPSPPNNHRVENRPVPLPPANPDAAEQPNDGTNATPGRGEPGTPGSTGGGLTTPPTAQNQPPIARGDAVTVPQSTATLIHLSASDSDRGPDALRYSIVAGPEHGMLGGTPPDLIYTSANDYVGPDHFQFSVNDGDLVSNVATISIDVLSPLPAPPSSPSPQSGTTAVPTDADLNWADSLRARSYDVYFRAGAAPDQQDRVATTAISELALDPLQPDTAYYWRVVARNEFGDSAGPVRTFQTQTAPPVVITGTWATVGTGLAGDVKAMCVHNGALYVGGSVTRAGDASVAGLAKWDGQRWSAVPGWTGGWINALASYNGKLYATTGTDYGTGEFDGTRWNQLGGGAVYGFSSVVYSGRLWIAQGGRVKLYDGSSLVTMTTPLSPSANPVLAILAGELYLGGGGTRIPNTRDYRTLYRYSGSEFADLPTFQDTGDLGFMYIESLVAAGGKLYVAGVFGSAGGVPNWPIVAWNGGAFEAAPPLAGARVRWTMADLNGSLAAAAVTSDGNRIVFLVGQQWHVIGEPQDAPTEMIAYNGELYVACQRGVLVDGVRTQGIARWHQSP